MGRDFFFTDWGAQMTVFFIIFFFLPPFFLFFFKMGVPVPTHYFFPRITEQALKKMGAQAERKREVGQQWGSANCGENFESALHEDQWLVKKLTESEEAAQEALSQIRAARLRTCRDLGYSD